MKYFLLGAFSSAIFLYGVALVYGATGSTRLDEIARFLAQNHLPKSMLLAAVALLILGLAFKVAAVPFHTWTPDVYQGSPTPATGFMAAVAKALFYLLTYAFMVIGSFAVVSVIGGKGEARNDLGAYRGLASRRPGLAITFTVLLLAQAGVPFTTGFLAKFYVVSAAVQQHQYALAVIAMLAAATAAFFYLRIAILMYSPTEASASSGSSGSSGSSESGRVFSFGGLAVATPPETRRILIPAGIAITLAVSVAFTIAFGIVPAPVIAFARRAMLLF